MIEIKSRLIKINLMLHNLLMYNNLYIEYRG